MSDHSNELSLIKVHTSIEVVVAAKDFDDAEKIVRENYEDIFYTMKNSNCALIEIHGYETIDELPENSPLRSYTPFGDEWGIQATCEYYTTVEKTKRNLEAQERQQKIENLIGALDAEAFQLLENYFHDRMIAAQ